jgi:hypothetical protein
MDSFLVQAAICAPPLDVHVMEKAKIDRQRWIFIRVIGATGTRRKKIEKCLKTCKRI